MAYLFGDGFDHYGTNAALYLRKYTGFTLATDFVRTGTNAIRINNSSTLALEQSAVSGIFGAAYRHTNFANGGGIEVRNGGSAVFSITVNNQGAVEIRANGYNGTVLATSAQNVIQVNQYQYWEVGYQNIGPNATVTVLVNNAIVVVAANVNLNFGAPTYLNYNWSFVNMDDYYEADFTGGTSYMGDVRMRMRAMTSNGLLANWTANGDANAWQCLNHIPPIPATNYISSAAAGDKSDFPLTALPTNVAEIKGVTVFCQALKTDAGGGAISFGIESQGQKSVKASTPLGTGNLVYVYSFVNDPFTGGPFTLANAQLAQAYIERTV